MLDLVTRFAKQNYTVNVIEKLVNKIAKLPGLGQRSARRIVMHLLDHPNDLQNTIEIMQSIQEDMRKCEICANIDATNPCSICANPKREQKLLCIVENISDMWSIERSGNFRGVYHILGGVLSPIDNITPEKLNFGGIEARIRQQQIEEVIVALGSTLDSQTTLFYLMDLLGNQSVKVSRLAFGIPVGANLDYMDSTTLAIAIKMRQEL